MYDVTPPTLCNCRHCRRWKTITYAAVYTFAAVVALAAGALTLGILEAIAGR